MHMHFSLLNPAVDKRYGQQRGIGKLEQRDAVLVEFTTPMQHFCPDFIIQHINWKGAKSGDTMNNPHLVGPGGRHLTDYYSNTWFR